MTTTNSTDENLVENKVKNGNSIADLAGGDIASSKRIDALLDDGGQTKTLKRTLFGIVALVVIFIVWSLMVQIDELARARGEIQPSGHVQTLQTEEGGRIVKIFVKEGDKITIGQPIVEFASTNLVKDREQIIIKVNAAAIDRERLMALLDNRKPDFSSFEADFPYLVEEALVSYRTQAANREAAVTAKRSSGSHQQTLLTGLENKKVLLDEELIEANDRLRRYEEGAKKGLIAQVQVSDVRQQVAELKIRQSELESQLSSMTSTIDGANAEITQTLSGINQQLSSELSKITEQYRQYIEEQKALNDRSDRILLKSPIDGVIMNLPQTLEGAVLAPGGVVAEIVPTNEAIIMEAWVQPRDIGFVEIGQRVSIKVDSFDSARFGAVEGTVRRVAPTSTKLGEAKTPFYKVEISLATTFVGSETRRLIPGMTGEANIATGRKSVMQFLLKPVFTAADTAFHER